jgi:hypothetical protein
MVLVGWPCDTPRSWSFAESTNIGGTRGHYDRIFTWWIPRFHLIIPSLLLLPFQSKSGNHIILFWLRVDGLDTHHGHGALPSRPILVEWRDIMALSGLGDSSNSTSQSHHNGRYDCNQRPACIYYCCGYGWVVMEYSPVMVVCWVDQYWRGDRSFLFYLDLV